MAGVELSTLPRWLGHAAQLVIGVSLAVRFSAEFLRAAPQWIATVALGTVGMIVACAGFAALLVWTAGLASQTLVLGNSPGGIAEMSITARALQLGVPIVTAFQVSQLVTVLMPVGPLYRWGWGRAR